MLTPMPTPSANINVVAAQLIAIWCAAIAEALIQPIISAPAEKAPTSIKVWSPTGPPSRGCSRNRGQDHCVYQIWGSQGRVRAERST